VKALRTRQDVLSHLKSLRVRATRDSRDRLNALSGNWPGGHFTRERSPRLVVLFECQTAAGHACTFPRHDIARVMHPSWPFQKTRGRREAGCRLHPWPAWSLSLAALQISGGRRSTIHNLARLRPI
jgi:hypothetical protein